MKQIKTHLTETLVQESGNKIFTFIFSITALKGLEGSYYGVSCKFYRDDIYNKEDADSYFYWEGNSNEKQQIPFQIPVIYLEEVINDRKGKNQKNQQHRSKEKISQNTCGGKFCFDSTEEGRFIWFDMRYGTEPKSHFIGNVLEFPENI